MSAAPHGATAPANILDSITVSANKAILTLADKHQVSKGHTNRAITSCTAIPGLLHKMQAVSASWLLIMREIRLLVLITGLCVP